MKVRQRFMILQSEEYPFMLDDVDGLINDNGERVIFEAKTASAYKNIPIVAGLNNFIEILYDGSVRARILLYSRNGSEEVSVPLIIFSLSKFRDIYKMLLGDESFSKKFICAYKYEKLTLF